MDDHPKLTDYDIDDDYIGVDPQRAEITDDEDKYVPQDERDVRWPQQPSVDTSHTFGRMEGDGSGNRTDEQIDARTATERDDRGGETGMDVSDADGYYGERIIREGKQRSRAEWLLLLNNGFRSKERKQENQEADNQRWLDAFTAQLSLTDYQKSRVETIINSVNMAHFGTYTVEIITLGTISLVTQEDNRMIRDERAFKELLVDVNGSLRDIRRVRTLVKEKSDLFGEDS